MSVPLTRKIRGFLQRRVPLMITCREIEDFILDYLDGALPWRQRVVFRAHMVLCRECRDYLASYEKAIALGKAVFQHPDEQAPDEVPEDLVRAILTARKAGEE
jgi:anti-sigma factor RsiW